MISTRLRRFAVVLLLAGQGTVTPGSRVCAEHLPAVAAALERVQRYVATAPRWGNTLDRLTTTTRSAASRTGPA